MSQEIAAIFDYLEKDRGIKRPLAVEVVRQGLVAAARKCMGQETNVKVEIDAKTGKYKVFAPLKIVEHATNDPSKISLARAREKYPEAQVGEVRDFEVMPKDFGRIAAQVFKQTLNQNLRQIERTMIYEEFKDRENTIVMGTVRRIDHGDVYVDLGKYEALLPAKERIAGEDLQPGDRIRAYVLSVDNSGRGTGITLSRSHPNFVKKLFELEVTELADGTITIKALAREAGYRTKIAVATTKEKIDPVGACVGVRGARVKNIVRELNNEKIDLFRWTDNVKELAVDALKPAKLKNVVVDEQNKRLKVTVDEDNYSLALGRRGQNARLASKILGYEIDIIKEETGTAGFAEKLARATQMLSQDLDIPADIAEKILRAGFSSGKEITLIEESDFLEATADLDPELAKKIYHAALNKYQETQEE
ncbi:MAG: transcription termination factor NusA [Methylacidiphilales bacterium]|nr:transcription termination factor NusA [Candidatus Methylacidiphilales bacterium]MDW8349190.1 transcription termination factor NusA [Verrucomicrobiae bacterium]